MQIPRYKTERLILQMVTLRDVPSYTKHFVDYEVIGNLSRTAPWPYPKNGVEEYIKTVIIPYQGISRWTWGIFLQDSPGELIGCVDLWKDGRPEHRGFWLGKRFWGKGIMTEAVYPIIDFAFDSLGFEDLIFSNAAGNIGSRRIKEKTGCELITIKPAAFVDPKWTKQELWKLTSRNWSRHKLSNPPSYVQAHDGII